ncbi:MAG: hydrogenase maturation protease [Acidobacteriota bacterium]
MKKAPEGVLFLCYGNPARLDDGLGAEFAGALQHLTPSGVDIEVDYQLNVEHALDVADHEHVIFVDAALDGLEPFSFQRIVPRVETSFTTHSVRPEGLMGLASTLFRAHATGYALGIRGYEFGDFGERLSQGARENLNAALRFVLERLQRRDYEEAARVGTVLPTGC